MRPDNALAPLTRMPMLRQISALFVCVPLLVSARDAGITLPLTDAPATQYFSYPGFAFDRLRREAPGQ